MKKCSTCKIEKNFSEFSKDRSKKDGFHNACKQCRAIERKEYYERHKEEIKQKGKHYRETHKKEKKQRDKKYQETHREEILLYQKQYRELHREEIKRYREIHREEHNKYQNQRYEIRRKEKKQYDEWYYETHKEEIEQCREIRKKETEEKRKQYKKQYRETHKEQEKQYRRFKLKNDINYKIACALRRRLNNALKGNFKSGSAVKDLGCSIDVLREYFEPKLAKIKTDEALSWENHGRLWHIDHIIPLSSFDLSVREELLKACHYTNLQPLLIKDNLKKGKKRIPKKS